MTADSSFLSRNAESPKSEKKNILFSGKNDRYARKKLKTLLCMVQNMKK